MIDIAILGGGESGIGSALLASNEGYQVFLSDSKSLSEKNKRLLIKHNIHFEEEGHSYQIISQAKEIIKSPGISHNTEIVRYIINHKIPLISEIEFAYRFCKSFIIAITGTNGKTTTCKLLYHILKCSGLDVILGGNIGTSFSYCLFNKSTKYIILELSSFQLEDIYTFKPDIASILNISSDHMDRYSSMRDYVAAKFSIAKFMTSKDYFVYPKGNYFIDDYLMHNTLLPKVIHSSDIDIIENNLPISYDNLLVIFKIVELLSIDRHKIKDYLKSFVFLPHRLEKIRAIGDVQFFNDSKSTNVDSTLYAITKIKSPIVWIVGGYDKGNDYSPLIHLVKKKVIAIIMLGIDNKKIVNSFHSFNGFMYETSSLQDAVNKSFAYGFPKANVLFFTCLR